MYFKNRGMFLETLINKTIKFYSTNERGIFHKNELKVSFRRVDKLNGKLNIKNGHIKTKEGTLATSRAGVFAGGDLVRGASTVVAAVADGMKAAEEIDEFVK